MIYLLQLAVKKAAKAAAHAANAKVTVRLTAPTAEDPSLANVLARFEETAIPQLDNLAKQVQDTKVCILPDFTCLCGCRLSVYIESFCVALASLCGDGHLLYALCVCRGFPLLLTLRIPFQESPEAISAAHP